MCKIVVFISASGISRNFAISAFAKGYGDVLQLDLILETAYNEKFFLSIGIRERKPCACAGPGAYSFGNRQ